MSAGQAGRIYWANAGAQAVSCANLDGSEARDVLSTTAPPYGLTLDREEGLLWLWCTFPEPHCLHMMELEGRESDERRFGLEQGPLGIATLHTPEVTRVIWSCYFNDEGAILYSEIGDPYPQMIAFGLEKLPGLMAFDPTGTLYGGCETGVFYWPARDPDEPTLATPGPVCGVAVDAGARTIYWTSPTLGRIEKSKLAPASFEPEILATPGATVAKPSGIAVDAKGERVYWANRKGGVKGAGTISWAKLDGSGGGDIEIAGATLEEPNGIALLLAPSVEALPTISGGSIVGGRPLVCAPGSCAPDEPGGFVFRDASLAAFQWLLEGMPIQGATEPTCSPQQAGYYSCAVTHTNAAGQTVAEPAQPHYVEKEG
ncbi:MAG TPA: hypothetical protein VFT10_09505 [Solirubrobacterales bacterium]|nr:hypothetical protein [Solirubrobacterales bacterium]